MDNRIVKVLHMTKLGAGGISTLTVNINTLIDRNKVHFDYLVFENEKTFYEEIVKQLGAEKRVVDVTECQSNKLLLYWNKYIRTRKMLLQYKYDVVHVDATTPLDVVIALAARHAGVKVRIIHSHNTSDKNNSVFRLFIFWLCKQLMKYSATEYFAVSKAAAKFMFPNSVFRRNNYRLIRNGILVNRYAFDRTMRKQAREELAIKKDELLLGTVGRLSEQKNHEFLIRVFSSLLKIRPSARLLIIGTGPLREKLEEQAEDLQIKDRIIFLGTTTNVPKYLMAMDCFVFPSLYEGLGLSALEAQCTGLDTFCSDGVPEEAEVTKMFHRIHGYSAEEWAERISKCTINECRKDYLGSVISAGYDLQTVTEDLQRFYERCVAP